MRRADAKEKDQQAATAVQRHRKGTGYSCSSGIKLPGKPLALRLDDVCWNGDQLVQ